MNYKYFLIGLVILLLGLLGYHYYAANEAADQIDEALQEQSRKPDNAFSIQYSNIDIHPFSGDIEFDEIRFTQPGYQYRASLLTFDLSYLDFLRFYWGGTDFGLRNLQQSHIIAIEPATEIHDVAREVSADTLIIDYKGNMYDMLRHAITHQPLENNHEIRSNSRSIYISEPGSSWGSFALDSLQMETTIPAAATSFYNADQFLAEARKITWTPPSFFREKYAFFIRGFGYQPDSIAIDSLQLQLLPGSNASQKSMIGDLHTDLFHLRTTAQVVIDNQSLASSRFQNGSISIPEISEQFDNFLQNSEQLFGITIPDRRKSLLQYSGPITNPNVSLRTGSNR